MAATAQKNPEQDTSDQNVGKSAPTPLEQSQTASERILDDNRRDNNNGTQGDSLSSGSTEAGALAVGDGQTPVEGTESVADIMIREVEQTLQAAADTAASISKMLSAGISPETAAKFAANFGMPAFYDSANGDAAQNDNRLEAATAEAKEEEEATEVVESENPEAETEGKESSIFDDLSNWAVGTFNTYVAEPVSKVLGDVSDVFDAAGEWMFQGPQGSEMFTSVSVDATNEELKQLTNLNNVSGRQFDAHENAATEGLERLNLNGATDASGQGLQLPEGAYEAGTINLGGNELTVMRTPGGDTFLKKGDKVIAQQREDGSYKLALNDGTTLDFRMSQGEDGKYNLDKMERFKGEQLQQKYQDGVYYNYNYDAQGNRTSVDAAADIDGPLSQERLDAIRAELGDRGTAALRVHDGDSSKRLLLQAHDGDTHSLTDIDAKLSQIFHEGQEYRLNGADQLALVGTDGQDQQPAEQDAERQAQLDKIAELKRRLDRRARGDSDENIDGVELRTREDGTTDINISDPTTGAPQTHIEMPADETQPISVTNSNGETARIERERFSIEGQDGNPIVEFDRLTGLQTDELKFDENGITDRESGLNILDSDGEFTSVWDEYLEEQDDFGGEDCKDCEEREEIKDDKEEKAHTLSTISLTHSVSGNFASAKILASIAFSAALGSECSIAISMASRAYNEALRGEQTQLAATQQGISDTTRLSEFSRIATMSSTTFSPGEFVRDRLRAA